MLGFVTIGQSPREDVVASMLGRLAPGVAVEAGALDELDRQEIATLAPHEGESPIVTRLRDGSEVVVAKERVMPLVQSAVERLEAAGCDPICLLCTGEFPRLGESSMIVYPDRLVQQVVAAILPTGSIGVLMPHAGQRDGMVAKWSNGSRSVHTAVASPYSASDQIADSIRVLTDNGVSLIVLDCMGFDRRMLADARAATGVPVVLSNGVVGSVLRELVDVSLDLSDQA